jgi:hypothetical protein
MILHYEEIIIVGVEVRELALDDAGDVGKEQEDEEVAELRECQIEVEPVRDLLEEPFGYAEYLPVSVEEDELVILFDFAELRSQDVIIRALEEVLQFLVDGEDVPTIIDEECQFTIDEAIRETNLQVILDDGFVSH